MPDHNLSVSFVAHMSMLAHQKCNRMRKHPEKISNYSINWSLGYLEAELVDDGSGRPHVYICIYQ